MNLTNPNKSATSTSTNRHHRRTKYKNLKIRTIAADYLSNIQLTYGSNETEKCYFDKCLSNDFDCFLTFNKITLSNDEQQQSDYFKYYRQKLMSGGGEKRTNSRLNEFLLNEFPQCESKEYVESMLSPARSTATAATATVVPAIQILQSNDTVLPTTITTTSPPPAAAVSYRPKLYRASKSPADLPTIDSSSNFAVDLLNNKPQVPPVPLPNTSNSALSARNFKRTISESSNESNYNTINSAMSQNWKQTYSIASNKMKPTIYHSLKRLTSEKLLFTSNSSPLGILSRLPFASGGGGAGTRLANNRSELNDSFIRARHISVTKANQLSHSHFICDVFELLDLDFDEYSKYGEMSYANLIDPIKQRSLRRAQTVDESATTNRMSYFQMDQTTTCDKIDEAYEELGEPDDTTVVVQPAFKKENSPYFNVPYSAEYLDDPQLTEMTAGKNRTCLKFASYTVSIIDYVKPLDLKKEINETFREKFPHIQISLTKLRSIKREMVEIALDTNLDTIIVAQAYIYFEKLILHGLINKSNRKHLAANCLILAAKLNDVTKKDINKLIDQIVAKFRFDNRKEVIAFEFAILIALEFNLMIKYEIDFRNHYERLINSSHYKKLIEQSSSNQPNNANNNNVSHNRSVVNND